MADTNVLIQPPTMDQVRQAYRGLLSPSAGQPRSNAFENAYKAPSFIADDNDEALLDALRACGAEIIGRRVPAAGEIYYKHVIPQLSYYPRTAEWRIQDDYAMAMGADTRGSIYVESGPGDGALTQHNLGRNLPDYYIGGDYVLYNKEKVQERMQALFARAQLHPDELLKAISNVADLLAQLDQAEQNASTQSLEERMREKLQPADRVEMFLTDLHNKAYWHQLKQEVLPRARAKFEQPNKKVVSALHGSTSGNWSVEETLNFLRHQYEIIGDNGAFHHGYDRTQSPEAIRGCYADKLPIHIFFYLGLRTECEMTLKVGIPRFEDFKYDVAITRERTNLDNLETVTLAEGADDPATEGDNWVEKHQATLRLIPQKDVAFDGGPMGRTYVIPAGDPIEVCDTGKVPRQEMQKMYKHVGLTATNDFPDNRAPKNVQYGVDRVVRIPGFCPATCQP